MKNKFLILFSIILIYASCNRKMDAPPSGELSIEAAPDEAGNKVLLRLKPKTGETQNMIVTMNLNSDDEKNAMNISSVSKMTMTAIKKEDTIYTYELRYKSMKMNLETGGVEMEYNSESKQENSLNSMIDSQMKGLLENPIVMKIDEMGRVLQFDLPGNFSKEQTGDLGSVIIPMPKEPVGIGDSWTSKKNVNNTDGMEMKMTIEKITIDFVQIKVNGILKSNKDSGNTEINGNYKLDRKTGFTKDGEMIMKINSGGKDMNFKIAFKSI